MKKRKRKKMKRKINHNDLLPWFTDDHGQLPDAYLKSCQRFFLELDRRQSEKQKEKDAKNNYNIKSS